MTLRIRYKTNSTDDDFASSLDPNRLRFVVGGTTAAGTYRCTLTPEDTSRVPIVIEFERTSEDDAAIAAALAARANVLATSRPDRDFLVEESSSATTTCSLAIQPNAPAFRPTFSAPAGATLTPDVQGAYPLVFRHDGDGPLSITVVACDSDVPLAPASGTVDLELVRVIDRTRPRGRKGHEVEDALAATSVVASANDQALNDAWTVSSAPAGWYWVRISGDTTLPAGTDALEVWIEQ